ncbi:TPA_asm: magnesium transporter CorA family protein, partial [Listeria monocytogenes]|nr:magnesium transporter CorA family protein [Listeria monocytogenes]HAC1768222.1 magnesium transporter CorA family protein [Listeria monocytogenes]
MSIQTIFGNGQYNWINIDTDNTDKLADFYEEYHIDDEVIAYSIDRNERAHFEYDQ